MITGHGTGSMGANSIVGVYHTGWRLHTLTAGICVSLLLSTLETTIVSTSLVSIVDALHGFDRSGWIVTAYLLTYTGVGGSGIYSLSTVMVTMMVPPTKYATYVAIITSVFAISSVLGPLLGGAINDNTTWRWVFFLNGPGGLLAIGMVAVSIPFGFLYGKSNRFIRSMVAERAWKRVDLLGALLSLAASILLVFAVQQGGVAYSWNSSAIIASFILSGILWIGFFGWERQLSKRNVVCEPMFPWRLVRNRFVLGLLFNGFLTGFPFMAAIINIPQRLQTVNSLTAIDAGIRLLPLLLLSPVASALSGLLISKLRVPPFYLLLIGGFLQTLGVGLYSSLDSFDLRIPPAQYGYQAIMGLGFGFNLSTILMMVPMVVDSKDTPVAMASVTQIRVLGGTIGLAVCSALLVNHIKAKAVEFLTPDQVAAILLSSENIGLLSPELQRRTRSMYATGYSEQMRVMLYFSLVSLCSLALLIERHPRRVINVETAELSTSH
ncbi:hypothetical protein M426DRAFT_259520 [Hypoxylon sp. CI-4A]|nr:hypothetical protein M426DRAFT_259520 [Hypoxylon sp. CI-4A]